eukprot:757175-Hanusia_phi.AAC.6
MPWYGTVHRSEQSFLTFHRTGTGNKGANASRRGHGWYPGVPGRPTVVEDMTVTAAAGGGWGPDSSESRRVTVMKCTAHSGAPVVSQYPHPSSPPGPLKHISTFLLDSEAVHYPGFEGKGTGGGSPLVLARDPPTLEYHRSSSTPHAYHWTSEGGAGEFGWGGWVEPDKGFRVGRVELGQVRGWGGGVLQYAWMVMRRER